MVLVYIKVIEYIYINLVEVVKIFVKYYNVEEEVVFRIIYKKIVGEGRIFIWKVIGEEYKNNL